MTNFHSYIFVIICKTLIILNKDSFSSISVSFPPTNEGGKLVTHFDLAAGGVPVFLSHSKHGVEPHHLHSSCFIL